MITPRRDFSHLMKRERQIKKNKKTTYPSKTIKLVYTFCGDTSVIIIDGQIAQVFNF
ncbi:MAG: hypothetical protein V1770_04720 [bacterium]